MLAVELETFFSIGWSAAASAQNTFTNRNAELDAFAAALAGQALDAPVRLVEDVHAPRRNILVFYGMGGVGKTRLSKELGRRYAEPTDPAEQRAAFRVDFEDGGSGDLEGILLGIRAALGRWKGAWPAFDLAFAVYWERAHPGVPLQSAVNTRRGGGSDLGSQLQDAIENLLESPGGVLGIFTSASRRLGRGVRQRLNERRLLRECPFFEPIIDTDDPAAMRTYLGSLLAWELARYQESQAQDDKTARLVVFLDTWERLQGGAPHRGDTEDLLARLVYLMPNVLFVVTGRNRLRWSDERSRATMQWAGPEHWPYLAESVRDVEPRQHLVGGLSATDAERFLCQRIVSDSEPAIPEDIRRVIVAAADGLPLYLDIAAVRFAQLSAAGATPTPDDFGQPLPEVVARLMQDLAGDQRTLLRVASLLHRFDEALLLAGAPGSTDAALSRFVQRPLVRRHTDDYAPFSIHESLREAVRSCDVTEDRWSDREWAWAGERLLAEIQRRVEPELGASGSVDGALLTGMFTEAVALAVRLDALPGWLWQLAGRLQSLGALDVLARTDGATPADSALRPAATGLAAVGRRRELGPAETARELRASLADPRLDPTGRDYLGYWLGWMLEETGRPAEAEQARLEVAAGAGPFTANVRHALGRSDWVSGRLGRALSWEFDDDDPLQLFWRTGIHGRVAWILGRFAEADALYAERLRAAERIGAPELVAHSLRTIGEATCFTTPGDTTAAGEAAAIYDRIGSSVSAAECRVAMAVARAGLDPFDEVLAVLNTVRPAVPVHAEVGEVFLRCVHGDLAGAQLAQERLLSARAGRSYGYWAAITGWWTDANSESHDVDWVHGEQDARTRWLTPLTTRRKT